jgi:hypothetical protein
MQATAAKLQNSTSLPPLTSAGALPIQERYGVTVGVAAEFVGISRSRIYELLAAGELDGKIIHGRRIVVVKSLLRMLGQAPSARREGAA